jgi:hypothetical protein
MLSFWMMPMKRRLSASSMSGLLSRISLNERIDAIGVRTSWLAWLRKSSWLACPVSLTPTDVRPMSYAP